jgi:hypothetical protein
VSYVFPAQRWTCCCFRVEDADGTNEGEDAEDNEEPVEEEALKESPILPERVIIGTEVVSVVCNGYTREAGVRSLERAIAALCRSVALDVAKQTAAGTMTTAPVELTVDVSLICNSPSDWSPSDWRH